MNIMIVEDEGITAFYLQETLSSLGCHVRGTFDNAKAALEFLEKNPVKIVFMDINIKGNMDGIQLAQVIYTTYSNVKFVFITSYKDSQTIAEVQSVKPLGYLIKPIGESDLEAILMVIRGQYGIHSPNNNHEKLQLKNFHYDLKEKRLYDNKGLITLSAKEQLCLDLLIKNKNSYVTLEQLTTAIWDDANNRENSLRELIYRLRKKISSLSINSTPNLGYSLIVEDD